MDEGPILPKVPLLSRFNHAITYVPEFKLYRIPPIRGRGSGNCRKATGAPVLLTRDAKLARTPGSDEQPVKSALSVDFVFDKAGNLHGQTERRLSEVEEIDLRGYSRRSTGRTGRRPKRRSCPPPASTAAARWR